MTTVNNKRENEKQDDAKETPIPSTPVRVRLHVAPTFSVVSGSAVSLSRPSPSPSLSDEDEHSPYMLRIHEEEQLQHHHTSSATLSQHPIPALTYSQVSGVELGLLPSHPNTNNNNGMNEEKEQKSLNDTLDEEEDGGETAYTDDTSYVYANDNNYDPHHVIDPNRIVVSSTAATETETNGSALYPLPTAVVDGAVTIRKYSVSHSGIPSSLRRIPSFYHQTFSGLPNDLLSLCMEYLTSRELCVIARVNQRCQQLSCMNKLWSVRCGFMQNADVASLLSFQWVLHNRPRLKDRFLLYRAWKIAKLETEWEQDRRLFQQRKIMCCLHWLDGYAFAGVLLLCFLIGVILLSVQLQSNHGSHIDIGTVTPFFVLVGYIFCVFICVCIARIDHLRPTGTAHKCCHPLSYPDPDRNGIIRNFFQNTLQDHTQQIILVSIMFLLACLWVILFLLRITEVITWSYPLVFIPLFFDFILIFFVCFHPLVLRSPWKNRMALFAWVSFMSRRLQLTRYTIDRIDTLYLNVDTGCIILFSLLRCVFLCCFLAVPYASFLVLCLFVFFLSLDLDIDRWSSVRLPPSPLPPS